MITEATPAAQPDSVAAEGTTETTTGTAAAPNTDAAAAASGTDSAAAANTNAAAANAGKKPDEGQQPAEVTLTLPEGSALDNAVLERIVATARERGLSQEQAEATLELLNATVAEQRAALLEAYQPGGSEWSKQVEEWKAAALADQSLGATAEARTARLQRGHLVVQRYAEQNPNDADAMKSFLNESGLGNHPAAVRFFAWIGEAMAEGTLVMPTAQGGAPKSAAEVLYGGTSPSHTE